MYLNGAHWGCRGGFTNNVDDVFQSLQKQAYGFRNTFGTLFSSLKQRLVPDELAKSHSTVRTLNFFGYSSFILISVISSCQEY